MMSITCICLGARTDRVVLGMRKIMIKINYYYYYHYDHYYCYYDNYNYYS